MIKNGVMIEREEKCFLCGKKGFKEIKDDVEKMFARAIKAQESKTK